jgi:FkbM family methyltransferase
LREELWWKLRSSPFVRKLATLPVLAPVMKRASLALLPSETTKVLQVKEGLAKGILFQLNPRWETGLWRGGYEPEAEDIMQKFFKPGMTFYDVGGGVGFYTLVAARLGAKVFTIEPDPKNFATIQQHAEMNHLESKMNLVPLAAYSHTGTLLMEPSGREKGHGHGHVQEVFGTDPGLCIEVACTTLDDFARNHPAPDLVKIDVEGCEADVFEGSEWLMKETRAAMLCEVHTHDLGVRIEEIVRRRNYDMQWLHNEGFPVRWLYATAR